MQFANCNLNLQKRSKSWSTASSITSSNWNVHNLQYNKPADLSKTIFLTVKSRRGNTRALGLHLLFYVKGFLTADSNQALTHFECKNNNSKQWLQIVKEISMIWAAQLAAFEPDVLGGSNPTRSTWFDRVITMSRLLTYGCLALQNHSRVSEREQLK